MRKRFTTIFAMLMAASLILAACAPATPTAPPPQEEVQEEAVEEQEAEEQEQEQEQEQEAADEVTLVVAADSDLQPGLDIHEAASFMTGQSLGIHVFDGLIQLGPEGYEPRLAESWEAADDGWIFHLRQDVTFHDGTPFNAEAVKYNVDRLLTGDFRQSSKWASVQSVEVVDDYTVKLVTGDQPSVAFLGQLVHAAAGAMQSPTAVENGEFPVGTGPFRFVEWREDEELVLEKNEDYWMEGPFIDRLVISVVPEAATRTLMLEGGDADLALYIPPGDAQRLMEERPDLVMQNPRSAGWRYIGLNTTKPPLDDVRVRRALNYAVDKQAIVDELLAGFTRVATSPYGSGMVGHVDVGPYPYDPERARELLAEAGYPDGFSITLLTNDGRPREALAVAQAVQGYLADVGVDAEIQVEEWGVFLDTIYTPREENTVEMHQSSYGGADLDTLRILLGCEEFPPNRNSTFYCDERAEELFQQGAFETDPEARQEIYAEIQEIVWEDAPWIFISELMWVSGWTDDVENVVIYEGNQTYYDLRWAEVNR